MFSRRALSVSLAVLLTATRVLGQDVPQFSGQRAMELLEHQCEIGPRTPGSEGNAQLRDELIRDARKFGLRVSTHCFETALALGASPVEICNIIVSAGPTSGPRLWLGAHYDSRPVCDLDPDPEVRRHPLAGANDGASGVAVLWHLMELMADNPPTRPVDLIFFDGEDAGVPGKPGSFCVGSARLAGTLSEFGNPLAGKEPEGLVLLDMVGDKDLFIPMEGYSLQAAAPWVHKVFGRARDLGLPAFHASRGMAIYDDHVPFLQQGIPAVDLIDFDYPPWHTSADTPEKCSPESLTQVGRLVADLLYRP